MKKNSFREPKNSTKLYRIFRKYLRILLKERKEQRFRRKIHIYKDKRIVVVVFLMAFVSANLLFNIITLNACTNVWKWSGSVMHIAQILL